MKRRKIEDLREKVGCSVVLEQAGFSIDQRQSTRRAMKYRRGDEIVIVTHEGRGWFDPRGERKGDVFALAAYLDHLDFPASVDRIGALVGLSPSFSNTPHVQAQPTPPAPIDERWLRRRMPRPGSPAWRYLAETRCLPASTLRKALAAESLREGPYGSVWAAHRDGADSIVGWEERGPEWRGFASGGAKTVFALGDADLNRLCVTEAAIDALSLAALEGSPEGTLYVSTGGGWSPRTEEAVLRLIARPGSLLVAATDANEQGDAFAERLRRLADHAGRTCCRLRPPLEDWNDVLKDRRGKRKGDEKRPAAGAPAASREAPPGEAGP